MAGLTVFLLAVGFLAATAVSYLILGAAADSRIVDSERRRQRAVDAFAAVLFADDPDGVESFPARRNVERDTLIEVVSSLPVDLGQEGRARLTSVLATPRTAGRFSLMTRSWWWRNRADAARLCGLMGTDEQRRRLLEDPHWAVRVLAVSALTPEQVATHADQVAAMLIAPNTAVQVAAASALPTGGVDMILPLNAILDNTGADREFALIAAGRVSDRMLVGALGRHLRSDHAHNRALAAEALARQSPIDAEPLLVEALTDDDESVRAAAVEALGRIGSTPVLTSLRAMLNDPSWLVRRATETSLKAAGPAGGMLVRQHQRRRPELDTRNSPAGSVPPPVARGERRSRDAAGLVGTVRR